MHFLDIEFLNNIRANNARTNATWSAGPTSLMMLPPAERAQRHGVSLDAIHRSLAERAAARTRPTQGRSGRPSSIPAAVDWRDRAGKSFVSSVKDQGSCNSCAAFGVCAAIDAAARIALNLPLGDARADTLQDLSEAQLFYVGGEAQRVTCRSGWWPGDALPYCVHPGLVPASLVPYTAGDQHLTLPAGWEELTTRIDEYETLYDFEEMKEWIATRGPLIATLTTYEEMDAYVSGVYRPSRGQDPNGGHCVCVIGYDDALEAWLCKNCWGRGWGMDGYFYVHYGDCTIENQMWGIRSFKNIYRRPPEDEITRFAVYPSIGVARVGNSPHGFFFGPELPGRPHEPVEHHDEQGRIKRQAAQFRVYGLNARNEVVKEITADDAEITWSVTVANTKAAWVQFTQPLDLPDAPAAKRRNQAVPDAERSRLAITPPEASISGRGVKREGNEARYTFTGKFLTENVYLGEVRTDDEGRLIFLGGHGVSANVGGGPVHDYANNDRWYDDVSDGPIEATVRYRGKAYRADGAWVVVGPPDYAPGVQSIVTGYDVIFEAATVLDPSLLPERPSFFEHIYPILRRVTAMQWVNAGFARDFGFDTPFDFTHPALVSRLGDRSEAARPLRTAVFQSFRRPYESRSEWSRLPPYYGEDGDSGEASACMSVLRVQYGWLEQWARGDFDAGAWPPPLSWEELTAAQQVRLIDRGVLDETLGGPFHPGAEFTWPMRQASLYASPFRIKRRAEAEAVYPESLPVATVFAENGPLDGASAGDLTRWLAVPWQADSAKCISAYAAPGSLGLPDAYLPTFWPARVPNDVLTEEKYTALLDPRAGLVAKQQLLSFGQRQKWLRGIAYPGAPHTLPYGDAMERFLAYWSTLGIVERRAGLGGALPDEIWVETGRSLAEDPPSPAASRTLVPPGERPSPKDT